MAITDYSQACGRNVTGNSRRVGLCPVGDITSITVVSGEITAITMTGAAEFANITADLDSVMRGEEGAGKEGNISYAHTLDLTFKKASKSLNALRNELVSSSGCGIISFVEDNNGVGWVQGYNETELLQRPLSVLTDSFSSGAAAGEEDTGKVTMQLGVTTGYIDLSIAAASLAAIKTAIGIV